MALVTLPYSKTILYGTYASFRVAVNFRVNSSLGDTYPTPGTLQIDTTTITFEEKDLLSPLHFIKKVKEHGVINWVVDWNGLDNYIYLTSTTTGSKLEPTITLLTLTNVFFDSQLFTDGSSPPIEPLDDIYLGGKYPIEVTITSALGTAKLYGSTGTLEQQAVQTLIYTEIPLTLGKTSITDPSINFLRVAYNGSSSIKVILRRVSPLGTGSGNGAPGLSPEMFGDDNTIYWRLEGETVWRHLLDIGEDSMKTKRVDNVGDYIYIGEAEVGTLESSPLWRISRVYINPTDGDVITLWAGGTALFDKVWTNRLGLSYT